MPEDTKKAEHIKLVESKSSDDIAPELQPEAASVDPEFAKQLEQDERELREIRVDLPDAGTSVASGLIAVGVGKAPKDEYFRVCPGDGFSPLVMMVTHMVGMDTTFCTV